VVDIIETYAILLIRDWCEKTKGYLTMYLLHHPIFGYLEGNAYTNLGILGETN